MTHTAITRVAAGRNDQSVIERAFELAQSGTCRNVHEIGLRLKREQFASVEAHLAGASIRRQLREYCGRNAAAPASAE